VKQISRTSHDHLKYSKVVKKLERYLGFEIMSYLNISLIPYLRGKPNSARLKDLHYHYSDVVLPYVKSAYNFGARYVNEIAGPRHEMINSEHDSKQIMLLQKAIFDSFSNKINSLINMQRTENRRAFQIITREKQRIAQQLSSQLVWKSYNHGVKSKGAERHYDLQHVKKAGLQTMSRTIRTPDLKQAVIQKVITGRIPESQYELTNLAKTEEEAALSFVFITQHDELVCEICRGMEFQSWAAGDPDFPNIPDDTHENCRCIMLLAEDSEDSIDKAALQRAILADTVFTAGAIKEMIDIASKSDEHIDEELKHALARSAAQHKRKKKGKKKTQH
jgi:hypothetical protein